jgi:hypothetical protein
MPPVQAYFVQPQRVSVSDQTLPGSVASGGTHSRRSEDACVDYGLEEDLGLSKSDQIQRFLPQVWTYGYRRMLGSYPKG